MVTVEIHSGLGNQMFQYAAGISLARFLKSPCKLEISWFENSSSAQTPNSFQLDKFPKIKLDFANKSEVDALIRPSSKGIVNRIKHKLNRSLPIHKQWAFVEPHFHYYKYFFFSKSPVFLSGYWQSEKYFFHIADEIRATFSIEIQELNNNYSILKEILNVPAVSLHIRRGDMVKNPEVAEKHGSCNLTYYKKAMSLIEKEVQNPVYFVFSDDIDWCKENLESNYRIVYVTGNEGLEAYMDIQLMRQCSHHIIANSSFSWWGAWLNSSPNKIVIAPSKWFNHDDLNTDDLIPSSWIRI